MLSPELQGVEARRNEKIAVIGSGVAGCLTACELASEGYNVSLIEERQTAFSGTSLWAIQAHLGGLYSANPETAKECLNSAIEFKRALPDGLSDRKALFLVANKSEASLAEYLEFYGGLANHYASLPLENQVFGPADKFFSILDSKDYAFAKNIEGGIATQEPGLHMPRLRTLLLNRLGKLGFKIVVNTSVIGVEIEDNRFTLSLKQGDIIEEASFTQVVNAGGYKARLLDHELGDRTPYNLYLKAWNIVDKPDDKQPLPSFYVVRGDFLHYSPVADGEISSLITANENGAYIDVMQYDDSQPQLPPEWIEILKSGQIPNQVKRQRASIEFAGDEFLHNANFTPLELIPGVAVSFSASRQNRTRRGAKEVIPGWQTVVPTKATNALELAREAKSNALNHSARQA